MKIRKLILFTFGLFAILLSACAPSIVGGFPSGSTNQDIVYVSVGDAVLAVRSDGTQVWRFPTSIDGARKFFGAPLFYENQVIVGDIQNSLYALDAANGVEKWSFKDAKGPYNAGPIAVSGMIITPNGDGNIYAVDLNGKLKWKFTGKASFWSTPVYDGKMIFAASMDHNLYAINPSNGTQAWTVDLGGSSLASPLVTEEGVIYIGTVSNHLLAINASDGKILWQYDTKGGIWSKVAYQDNVIYIGDLAKKVYAIEAKEGVLIWEKDVPGPVLATPAVFTGGMMVVCETGEVVVLGYKSEQFWTDKITNDKKLYSSPIVIGERLVVPIYQGDPVAVTYDFTGRKGWTLSAPK